MGGVILFTKEALSTELYYTYLSLKEFTVPPDVDLSRRLSKEDRMRVHEVSVKVGEGRRDTITLQRICKDTER